MGRFADILIGPEEPARLEALADGLAPRLDYRLVAGGCGAAIHRWVPAPSGLHGPRVLRLGRSFFGNLARAFSHIRSLDPASVVYSTGETWGLPVALAARLLGRRFVHVVYAHRLYSPRWRAALHHLRWLLPIDGWICVNGHQAGLLRGALEDQPCQIRVVPQGVDTQFYDPALANPPEQEPYLLSVGAEMRDYRLLLAAVRGLDTPLILKPSSTWMRRLRDEPGRLPAHVRLLAQRLSYVELRDLYAGAALVAVPLYDSPQAAGITTILEAMAMGKAVVVTRSRGLPDGLSSGENSVIVEPDPARLAAALITLLEKPAERERIAAHGRRLVLAEYRLEHHAQRVHDFLRTVAESR
jgi:glycosyltransferase involved in cell wall biosynthesis